MQTIEKQPPTPKTRSKGGTVKGLKTRIWRTISTLSRMVSHGETESLQVKAASSMAALAGAWIRAHESEELERRITALEAERSGGND